MIDLSSKRSWVVATSLGDGGVCRGRAGGKPGRTFGRKVYRVARLASAGRLSQHVGILDGPDLVGLRLELVGADAEGGHIEGVALKGLAVDELGRPRRRSQPAGGVGRDDEDLVGVALFHGRRLRRLAGERGVVDMAFLAAFNLETASSSAW